MGHLSWKCPNSLHLKHLLLSLFIGLAETLECLVLGAFVKFTKGSFRFEGSSITKLSASVSSVEDSKCPFHPLWPFIKVSFEFSSGLGQKGLKGFLYWVYHQGPFDTGL